MLPQSESAPDFSDPLGLLRACHRRIEHFAELALRLADHPIEAVPPAAVREAAAQILRYFDQAGPLHHADEEWDLLPCLRRRLGEAPGTELDALLAGLDAQHARLDRHWQRLRPHLVALSAGRAVDGAAYLEAARAFHEAQLAHVVDENNHLLPAAEAWLAEADLAALGQAMARRRGVGQNKG